MSPKKSGLDMGTRDYAFPSRNCDIEFINSFKSYCFVVGFVYISQLFNHNWS